MPVFESEIAKSKIIVNGAGITTAEPRRSRRRTAGTSVNPPRQYPDRVVHRAVACRQKGDVAATTWSTSKACTFGVVHPDTDFDMAVERVLTDAGGAVAEELEFDTTAGDLDQAVGTFINRLKAAGITSVVLFTDPGMMSLVMRAATTQDYFPEWVITGWGYTDWDGFGRSGDAEQMKHALVSRSSGLSSTAC